MRMFPRLDTATLLWVDVLLSTVPGKLNIIHLRVYIIEKEALDLTEKSEGKAIFRLLHFQSKIIVYNS